MVVGNSYTYCELYLYLHIDYHFHIPRSHRLHNTENNEIISRFQTTKRNGLKQIELSISRRPTAFLTNTLLSNVNYRSMVKFNQQLILIPAPCAHLER